MEIILEIRKYEDTQTFLTFSKLSVDVIRGEDFLWKSQSAINLTANTLHFERRTTPVMLQNGVIEPSNSYEAASVVLVKKKDGTLRSCVDNQKQNSVTHRDTFLLSRIDDTIDTLLITD